MGFWDRSFRPRWNNNGRLLWRWLHLIVLPLLFFPPVDRLQVLGDACDLRATPRGAPKPCLDAPWSGPKLR